MANVSIERLHRALRYDSETGLLHRNEYVRSTRAKIGDVVGSINFEGYITAYVDQSKFHAHRIAWALFHGAWPDDQVDHINGDRSDNRISNLRLADHSKNQANTKPRSKWGAKGVTPLPNGKWQAQIGNAGVRYYLGTHHTLDEAAHAYNKAAIEMQGEFAVLNPVGQDKFAVKAEESGGM